MRISIRRCLSMLRNTSDGNALAVPATNAYQKEHSVSCFFTIVYVAAHALVCRGPRPGAALAYHLRYSTAELYCRSRPVGGYAGLRQCSALKAVDIVILL